MTRASDTAKLLGAGATILDGTTISTADNTDSLILQSTDADANVGPNLKMSRQSASAADNDLLGKINFIGHNDAGTPEDISYGDISGTIIDASDGTEDGMLAISTMVAGTTRSRIKITNDGTVFNEDSQDIDFRIESNDETHMFIVDAANNTITMGTQTGSGALLHVINDAAGPFLTTANATAVFTGSSDVGKGGCIGFDFGVPHTNYPVGIGYAITSQAGSTKGDLVFGTRNATSDSAPTERLRLLSSGKLLVNTTAELGTSGQGVLHLKGATNNTVCVVQTPSNGEKGFDFYNSSGSRVGFIAINASSTTFSTSSDYRLKENVTTSWDATTRLKQLKPARFNFIVDADTTVDGFLAHEVSSIVPEAVSGTKDATQDVGIVKDALGAVLKENVLETDKEDDETWTKTGTENVYQGIDQAKLVPLLVKTIQELEARITALESA